MKRLSLAILSLLLTFSVLSQPRLEEHEYYLGIQGGALASMVRFSPTVTQSALKAYVGPTAGLLFRYSGHKCCGLQLELNYMQRGWRETTIGYRRELDYIEMPFLTHIYFGNKFRGFVNLGPQIGVLINEKHYNLPPNGRRNTIPPIRASTGE